MATPPPSGPSETLNAEDARASMDSYWLPASVVPIASMTKRNKAWAPMEMPLAIQR